MGFLLGAILFSGGTSTIGGAGGGQFIELFDDYECKMPVAVSVATITAIKPIKKRRITYLKTLDDSFYLCQPYSETKKQLFKKPNKEVK